MLDANMALDTSKVDRIIKSGKEMKTIAQVRMYPRLLPPQYTPGGR